MIKPSIPKGTRDFTPEQMIKRNFIFETIKSVFRAYGFLPLETPAIENLSTLLGKYGEEGDRLIFKILNSGDYLNKVDGGLLDKRDSSKLTSQISEKGLRYDLTVPFARYVVQNRNDVTMPFRRYQVQPVWRADRPQKGRYREFYQCDADVIGTYSLLCENDLLLIIRDVFNKLQVAVQTKINNRKVLFGIAETAGITEQFMDMTIAIDKLEKIGMDGVVSELSGRGISESAIEKIREVFEKNNLPDLEKISFLKGFLDQSETGLEGVEELETLIGYRKGDDNLFDIDLTLARGLNYYTGTIFEVVATDVSIGSICGGGRYDDLTGVFGMPGISGVGISFGADRIYDVMAEKNLFPAEAFVSTQVLIVNFGGETELELLKIAEYLRKNGVRAEIYPEASKMKKQMAYANKLNIPFVLLVGEDELKRGKFSLKNMHSGEQSQLKLEEIITTVQNA